MITVPPHLYSKEIKSFIDYLVTDKRASDFDSLDEIHKDKLVGLGIKAFGSDIDIYIGSDVNEHLSNYLLSYDNDEKIDLLKALKASSHEHFSNYFNVMIDENIPAWRKSA